MDKWDELNTNAHFLDEAVGKIKKAVRLGAVKVARRKKAIKELKPAVEEALASAEEIKELANSI